MALDKVYGFNEVIGLCKIAVLDLVKESMKDPSTEIQRAMLSATKSPGPKTMIPALGNVAAKKAPESSAQIFSGSNR